MSLNDKSIKEFQNPKELLKDYKIWSYSTAFKNS